MYDTDKYKTKERPYNSTEDREKIQKFPKVDDSIYEMKKQKTIRVTDHLAMPRIDGDTIEPLMIVGSEVIGNIFDRVKFLEQRIADINSNVELRTGLHESIVKEIEKDIDDKNNMLIALSDPNERRNIKLDISVLRKEKRHEDVQFWKDVMELNTELNRLTEEYEVEKKIASIFGKVGE